MHVGEGSSNQRRDTRAGSTLCRLVGLKALAPAAYAERGRRIREGVELVRRLWRGDVPQQLPQVTSTSPCRLAGPRRERVRPGGHFLGRTLPASPAPLCSRDKIAAGF